MPRDNAYVRFLADTNIIIKLDPPSADRVEPDAPEAMEFFRLATRNPHDVVVHPAIEYDFARDSDAERARFTEIVSPKYNLLVDPPSADPLAETLGPQEHGSNDWVDHLHLSALRDRRVDYLVTEDQSLRRKASNLGLGGRCLSLADALTLLRSLYDVDVSPPPHVERTTMAALDESDSMWESFRLDYPEFDAWFSEKRIEDRPAWRILAEDGSLAGIVIGKLEFRGPQGLPEAKVFKICSFKVADHSHGLKYGELLLKAIFQYLCENSYDRTYTEVFEHHEDLVELLHDFGFHPTATSTPRGEWVLVKRLVPSEEDLSSNPLEYHVTLGPPAVHPAASEFFIIPIEPRYSRVLFPSPDDQPTLPGLAFGSKPFGNAIRKAYLSRSPIRSLTPGSVLLFYRSHDTQALTDVGIVESVLVSDDVDEIASFVGVRTVYSYSEIEELTRTAQVVSILFRHDRSLVSPVALSALIDSGALLGAPQSITSVREEGLQWLRTSLDESP
jgi:L-amino acid N-acyltransferase YncA